MVPTRSTSILSSISLPTGITLVRLAGVPFILLGLQWPVAIASGWTVVLFLAIAATDWLDGYLARRLNQVTELGKVLDPLVDKLMVMAPLLGLLDQGRVSVWGVFLILLRELGIAGWRVNQTSISGANQWGKAKTVSQILAIALLLAPLPASLDPWVQGSFWVAVALTLISGGLYLWPQTAAKPPQA